LQALSTSNADNYDPDHGWGGGVYNTGTLSIINGTIIGNSASTPDTYADMGWGGGIANFGTATVTRSNISDNFTGRAGMGGGIMNYNGTLTLTSSIVSLNTAGVGGGISNSNGTLTVLDCIISDNLARSGVGGGIQNIVVQGTRSAILTITNSEIVGNTASGFGGGICSLAIANSPNTGSAILTVTNSTISGNTAASSYGGGIHCSGTNSSLTITNSTISGNRAREGGGISKWGDGTAEIINCTIAGNFATATNGGGGIYNASGTTTLYNTIVAWNAVPTQGSVDGLYAPGANVVGTTGDSTNIIDTPPRFVKNPFAADGVNYADITGVHYVPENWDLRPQSAYANFNLTGKADGNIAPSTDMDGNKRYFEEGHFDVGAYHTVVSVLEDRKPTGFTVYAPFQSPYDPLESFYTVDWDRDARATGYILRYQKQGEAGWTDMSVGPAQIPVLNLAAGKNYNFEVYYVGPGYDGKDETGTYYTIGFSVPLRVNDVDPVDDYSGKIENPAGSPAYSTLVYADFDNEWISKYWVYQTYDTGVHKAGDPVMKDGLWTGYIVDKVFSNIPGCYTEALVKYEDGVQPEYDDFGNPIYVIADAMLVFRGTSYTFDVFLDSNKTGVGYSQYEAFRDDAIAKAWLEKMEGVSLTLVGHSLGGALAQWMAADLCEQGVPLKKVETYNSTGISWAYADKFKEYNRGTEVVHHIVNGDFVSMLGDAFITGFNANCVKLYNVNKTDIKDRHELFFSDLEIKEKNGIETISTTKLNSKKFGFTDGAYQFQVTMMALDGTAYFLQKNLRGCDYILKLFPPPWSFIAYAGTVAVKTGLEIADFTLALTQRYYMESLRADRATALGTTVKVIDIVNTIAGFATNVTKGLTKSFEGLTQATLEEVIRAFVKGTANPVAELVAGEL